MINTKIISLTNGHSALIDEVWFPIFSQFKWQVLKSKGNNYCRSSIYADSKHSQELMHRIIMAALPHQLVDHINGNGLDNRRCNLRLCNFGQNAMNAKVRKNKESKYKGVFRCQNKWCAKVRKNRKTVFLKAFNLEVDAAKAYNKAAAKHFGEFAFLNLISKETV